MDLVGGGRRYEVIDELLPGAESLLQCRFFLVSQIYYLRAKERDILTLRYRVFLFCIQTVPGQ